MKTERIKINLHGDALAAAKRQAKAAGLTVGEYVERVTRAFAATALQRNQLARPIINAQPIARPQPRPRKSKRAGPGSIVVGIAIGNTINIHYGR